MNIGSVVCEHSNKLIDRVCPFYYKILVSSASSLPFTAFFSLFLPYIFFMQRHRLFSYTVLLVISSDHTISYWGPLNFPTYLDSIYTQHHTAPYNTHYVTHHSTHHIALLTLYTTQSTPNLTLDTQYSSLYTQPCTPQIAPRCYPSTHLTP